MRETTYIESLGVYLPPNETSSESRVAGIRSGLKIPLRRFTGIESTRHVNPGEYSFDLACRAIESTLAKSSFNVEEIGLVVACNISKYDHEGYVFPIEPNTATRLRKAIGFKNALAFDINNACAGMFTGILVADCLLHATDIPAALVVSGEYISHLSETAQREITSFSDPRLACLTLGDAGAAVVLARAHDDSVGFHHIGLRTLGAHSSLCVGKPSGRGPGGIMMTEAGELLRVGTRETAQHLVQSLRAGGWISEMIDHVIGHQVSKGCNDSFLRHANSRLDGARIPRKKMVDNLPARGNTASTSHIVALHDHIRNNRIGPGDRVVFSIAASGLTVGTALYALDELPTRLRNGVSASKLNGRAAAGATRSAPSVPSEITVTSVATTRSRHRVPRTTEEISLEAAELCLQKAPCGRQDIGVLLFAGVYKSGFIGEPSYASILSGMLFPDSNASDCATEVLAFDIQDGPNGFLTACEILRTMVARRRLRAGMVIACEFENNRLLEGYPTLGIAEIASAAVIMGPAEAGACISNWRTFSFDEYADLFRTSLQCANTPHVSIDVREDYETALRVCIRRAIGEYLPDIGRTLDEFDDFYFPQVSRAFLDSLAEELKIPRRRLGDVTMPGMNLYTSGLPCLLESCAPAGIGRQGRLGLAVSAGPGINVGCAVIRI